MPRSGQKSFIDCRRGVMMCLPQVGLGWLEAAGEEAAVIAFPWLGDSLSGWGLEREKNGISQTVQG